MRVSRRIHSEWKELKNTIRECSKCPISCNPNRVIIRGQLPCKVLFIGEAPGPSEIELQKPFVGPSGKLLDKLIEKSGLEQRYSPIGITNSLMCYPEDPKTGKFRQPTNSELNNCRSNILHIIQLAQPDIIVRVGKIAQEHIKKAFYDYIDGIQQVDIHHPSYMLRKGGESSQPYAESLCTLTNL